MLIPKPKRRIPRLKASPAGGAMIINTVIAHFKAYGPIDRSQLSVLDII